ncbi:MAG: hypothetical protein DWQ31_07150 [Planctomycetota bacterium]|nr:MAG: hypothetical protein DWQ31_07150 [Planctomycetota bacterium]
MSLHAFSGIWSAIRLTGLLLALAMSSGCGALFYDSLGVASSGSDGAKADAASAVNESGKSAETGVPAADIDEINSAIAELRDLDPATYNELNAQWQASLKNLEKTDAAAWPSIKSLYLTTIRSRKRQLQSKTGEDEASDTESTTEEPRRSAARGARRAKQQKAQRLAVKRRQSKNPNGEHDEDALTQADREAPQAETSSATPEVPVHEAAAQRDGWFFLVEEDSPNASPAGTIRNVAHQAAEVEQDASTRPRGPQSTEHTQHGPSTNTADTGVADATTEPASATNEPAVAADWRDNLTAAIHTLEAEIEEGDFETPERDRQEAILRLLYLANGRRDAAVRTVSSEESQQREFWSKQMYALSLMLDEGPVADRPRRATAAGAALGQAQQHLAAMGDLILKNMTFCTSVTSFAIYQEFDRFEFVPGQQTLVYVEIENFRHEETGEGQRLSFGGSYQIFDHLGRMIVDRQLAEFSEVAQDARRDFYLHYAITLPQRVDPGEYTLQLSIEDNVRHQIAQSRIDFEIRGAVPKNASQLR